MRATHYRRLAEQLQTRAVTLLLERLRPTDFSRRCPALLVLTCLVLAAARRLALAAVAAVRPGCPSRETLRQAVLATLPQYDELRRRLPEFLRAALPKRLARRPGRQRYAMAADLHRVLYYKRGRTPPAHVRKGQRRAGTRYAHDYATLSLLRKGQYYVVAMTPVDPGETYAAVLRRLVRQAAAQGLSPKYLLLDRSFWSTDVFRYLQRARVPFLLPVLARGRKATAAGGATGTRALLAAASGRYPYRVHDRYKRRGASVTVVVVRRRRPTREGKRAAAYAMWRMALSSVRWVAESYRRRYRIESSYRLLETGRARTSSREERLRLWYALLAAVLVNLWLTLRREAARPFGRHAGPWYVEALVLLTDVLLHSPLTAPEPQTTAPPNTLRRAR